VVEGLTLCVDETLCVVEGLTLWVDETEAANELDALKLLLADADEPATGVLVTLTVLDTLIDGVMLALGDGEQGGCTPHPQVPGVILSESLGQSS
jgi:hypothetical protein